MWRPAYRCAAATVQRTTPRPPPRITTKRPLAQLFSDRRAFLEALPNASDAELVGCTLKPGLSNHPDLIAALVETLSQRLPTISSSAVSTALHYLSLASSSSSSSSTTRPAFEAARPLLLSDTWELTTFDACRLLLAYNQMGYNVEQFPEATDLAQRYIKFDSVTPHDVSVVLRAMKTLGKKNLLEYEQIDQLGNCIQASLQVRDRQQYTKLVDLFLPWLTLRPKCAKGHARQLVVAQNLALQLRQVTPYALGKMIPPEFAPRLKTIVNFDSHIQIDSITYQRLIVGFERVQKGLNKFNMKDWFTVLNFTMDFCHDHLHVKKPGDPLPDWVKFMFENVGKEVKKVHNNAIDERPSPVELIIFLELYTKWVPQEPTTKELSVMLMKYSVTMRDRLTNKHIADLAALFRTALDRDSFKSWVYQLDIPDEQVAPFTKARTYVDDVIPEERRVEDNKNVGMMNEAHERWIINSRIISEGHAAVSDLLVQESHQLATESVEKVKEVEQLIHQRSDEIVKEVSTKFKEEENRMKELIQASISQMKQEEERIKQNVIQMDATMRSLNQEMNALKSKLQDMEQNSLSNKAKEVYEMLKPSFNQQVQQELNPYQARQSFDFNTFLRETHVGNRVRVNHRDPIGLSSFQSQVPKPRPSS